MYPPSWATSSKGEVWGRADNLCGLTLPWPLQSNLQLPAETHGVQAHVLPVAGLALEILAAAELEIDVTAGISWVLEPGVNPSRWGILLVTDARP